MKWDDRDLLFVILATVVAGFVGVAIGFSELTEEQNAMAVTVTLLSGLILAYKIGRRS